MTIQARPFHGIDDRPKLVEGRPGGGVSIRREHYVDLRRKLTYRFLPHYQPYAGELVQRLINGRLEGLEAANFDPTLVADLFKPASDTSPAAAPYYAASELVQQPYPIKDIDFTTGGAYSVYNWELFFHIPLAVAIHLSQNQRFEEAQRWFHFIFDPTDDSNGPTPERFWKVRPLQRKDIAQIEDILANLSNGVDPQLYEDTINSIAAWKAAPFRPYVIARYRPTAYMYKAVMAYLDNLIAWGDSLFREDTGEAINEATQVYVLAANLLGPRPEEVPEMRTALPQSYASMRSKLNGLGNALVNLENDLALDVSTGGTDQADGDPLATLRSLGQAFYFCVPRNDKLLAYWDTVADRLFKIRNSLNIEGVFRQLPLFEPPIDPALLVKAAAAGLDVAAVMSGLEQPLSPVRCTLLLQRANEICAEVKSLGAQLLATIEKGDGESLSIMRARHERSILVLGEAVKYAQYQEAIKTREGLQQSIANAAQRFSYYEQLLGTQKADVKLPELEPIDTDRLLQLSFDAAEPVVDLLDIEIDVAQSQDDPGGKLALSSREADELAKLGNARDKQIAAGVLDIISSVLGVIPSVGAHGTPIGVGGSVKFGGPQLAALMQGISKSVKAAADEDSYEAAKTAKLASYQRRQQEHAYQRNSVAGELMQLFKQLRAAEIREAATNREWETHQQQIKNAEEIETFLTDDRLGKRTNEAFYGWMKREAKALYAQSFQLAFDVAKKAERALQHELGDPSLSYIEYGYLAGKEGLLAGEKLGLDLKRMEMSYLDLNRREYELTRHVSLLELDPMALLSLRATGQCTITLPEELFDLDCPGHYFRRLRTVAVSLPCVAGPYSPVPCTLTLVKSSLRTTAIVADGYARGQDDDARFRDQLGSVESVVTSVGQNDAGVFDVSLRDERLLPFEGAGAISQWRLRLPNEIRQFDYDTIGDVVLHLRYTAREGGDTLRNAAIANLQSAIDESRAAGSVRLISIRHEFPAAWAKLKNTVLAAATPRAQLAMQLRDELYPFWARDRAKELKEVVVIAQGGKDRISLDDSLTGTGKDTLSRNLALGGLRVGKLTQLSVPDPTGALTLYIDDNTMDELWFALAWGKP